MNIVYKKLGISSVILVIVNIIPILGVLFWDYSVLEILLLYWAESAIIGIFNILKMLITDVLKSLFFVPFFIVHYGGFMAGHLMFLLFLFSDTNFNPFELFSSFQFLQGYFVLLAIPLAGLFISHFMSFIFNFVKNKEYQNTNIMVLMFAPYSRIILLHITIILGAFVAFALGQGILVLLILVALKTIIDLIAHNKEHQPITNTPPVHV